MRAARRRATAIVLTGLGALALGSVPASPVRAAGTRPYLDPLLPPAERAADLISRMTLAEKAAQLASTNAPAIPRLGVQEYAYWSEAQHGVNAFWGGDATSPTGVDINNVQATSFPTNLSASLTWDPALIRREMTAVSDEARGFLDPARFGHAQNDLGPAAGAYGSLVYWAPTVNLDRDPRWGRVDEGFGEDPFLAGTLGSAYIEGMQGEDAHGRLLGRYLKTIATLKHYALNNVENDRMGLSSNTDEATIRDYYTRQFRQIIQAAHAAGVMSSYNSVNGVPATANNLTLNVLLRRTFGFTGYTTSDCGAIGTIYRSDNPNNPLAGNPTSAALATSGHDWSPPGWSSNHGDQADLWTRVGDPLAVISGRAGAEAYALRAGTALNCVGDNGQVGHPAFWDSLRHIFSDENGLVFIEQAIGAGILSEGVIDRALLPVFTQRIRTGEFDPRGGQPYTRITQAVIQSPAHRQLTQTLADEALTLLQNRAPRRSRAPLLPVDPARVRRIVVLGDQANTAFLGDYSGQPSEQVSVRQGIERAVPHAQVTYDAAGSSDSSAAPPALSIATRQAIRAADLVVVMVGTDANTNTEGFDRRSLALPGNYRQLIDDVAAAGNPRIVLLDQSAGPVDLRPVEGKVPSILFSAANGERQGSAAADAIFGRTDPSGHLSFTWYAGDGQLPPKNDYDLTPAGNGGLGRTYMYFTGRPTYPFGYGLSYTRFRFGRTRLSRRTVPASGTVRVTVRVTNAGRRAGATVVQVYAVPPPGASVARPRQQLVGFARTAVLHPRRSQSVTVSVPLSSALRRWDARAGREVVAPGLWRLRVSRSAGDVGSSLPLRVTGAIPGTVATVAIAPPTLDLSSGQALDLRGRNPWLGGLAPAEPGADTILSAVRADDSPVDLTRVQVGFRSDRPDVLRVDSSGVAHAVAPGVATVTVTVGGRTASTPFVVR